MWHMWVFVSSLNMSIWQLFFFLGDQMALFVQTSLRTNYESNVE